MIIALLLHGAVENSRLTKGDVPRAPPRRDSSAATSTPIYLLQAVIGGGSGREHEGRNGLLLVNRLLMWRATKLHRVIGRRPSGRVLLTKGHKKKTRTPSYMGTVFVQLVFAKHNITTLSLHCFALVETEFLFGSRFFRRLWLLP